MMAFKGRWKENVKVWGGTEGGEHYKVGETVWKLTLKEHWKHLLRTIEKDG